MTTEEIIKSLKACAVHRNCGMGCVFDMDTKNPDCLLILMRNAARRLKELSSELEDERHRHDRYVDFELDEAAELAKVKKERDAAIKELRYSSECYNCKRNTKCHNIPAKEPSFACGRYEWRGVNPDADN